MTGPVERPEPRLLMTAPPRPAYGAERGGQDDHRAEPIGPLPGGGGGRHDHGAHEDDADGLKADDDGDDKQEGKQSVEQAHGIAEAGAEVAVEAEQLEFLPEERHKQQSDPAERSHDEHVAAQKRGGLAEEKGVQAGLAGIGVTLQPGEQHQAKAEENGKNDAERAVLFDACVAGDGHEQKHAGDTGGDGPEHQHERRLLAGEHEGQDDAREGGVGHGVTQQALATQHGERAKRAADDAQHDDAGGDGAQGIVEEETLR